MESACPLKSGPSGMRREKVWLASGRGRCPRRFFGAGYTPPARGPAPTRVSGWPEGPVVLQVAEISRYVLWPGGRWCEG